jgi:hypothetical protein
MLRLFTRFPNSALDIKLVARVPTPEWEALRRNTLRLMKGRFCYDGSLNHLKETPYELWRGTNGFGDQFELLYYKADIEAYTEVERENDHNEYLHNYAYPDIATALESLGRPIRFIAVELQVAGDVPSVPAPGKLEFTSAVVEAALADAETLIRTSGPANALDRVHTALHGYLETICDREFISYEDDASITSLFAAIRKDHPVIQIKDPEAQRMTVLILRGMALVVDALDRVRDKKSLAHPNTLLDEAEAMLAINTIRTLLHYFDKRLK